MKGRTDDRLPVRLRSCSEENGRPSYEQLSYDPGGLQRIDSNVGRARKQQTFHIT